MQSPAGTTDDRPVPADVLAMAQQAVKDFHECFWWWNTQWVPVLREEKKAWIEMSDRAEAEITRIADTMPETPIGVAFVDSAGKPGWIGHDTSLRCHALSVRGCWPTVTAAGKA